MYYNLSHKLKQFRSDLNIESYIPHNGSPSKCVDSFIDENSIELIKRILNKTIQFDGHNLTISKNEKYNLLYTCVFTIIKNKHVRSNENDSWG